MFFIHTASIAAIAMNERIKAEMFKTVRLRDRVTVGFNAKDDKRKSASKFESGSRARSEQAHFPPSEAAAPLFDGADGCMTDCAERMACALESSSCDEGLSIEMRLEVAAAALHDAAEEDTPHTDAEDPRAPTAAAEPEVDGGAMMAASEPPAPAPTPMPPPFPGMEPCGMGRSSTASTPLVPASWWCGSAHSARAASESSSATGAGEHATDEESDGAYAKGSSLRRDADANAAAVCPMCDCASSAEPMPAWVRGEEASTAEEEDSMLRLSLRDRLGRHRPPRPIPAPRPSAGLHASPWAVSAAPPASPKSNRPRDSDGEEDAEQALLPPKLMPPSPLRLGARPKCRPIRCGPVVACSAGDGLFPAETDAAAAAAAYELGRTRAGDAAGVTAADDAATDADADADAEAEAALFEKEGDAESGGRSALK